MAYEFDEYIRRGDVYHTVLEKPDMTEDERAAIILRVNAIPAADVQPVVRGKWIDEPIYKQTFYGETYDGYTYCSNCKADYPFGHKAYFCEVCGADMRDNMQKKSVD